LEIDICLFCQHRPFCRAIFGGIYC
jgi:hypothetical protein